MRRKATDAQKVGARRETLDASEARHEIRDVRRVSSLSSCNLVTRLTSHAPAPWPKVRLGEEGGARRETIDASIASSLASKTARVSRLTSHAPWPTVLLGEVTIMKRGKYITRNDTSPGDVPVILGGQEPAYYCDKANHTGPCVVISRSGASAGFVSYWAQPIFVTDGFLFEANEQSNIRYVYYCLKANQSLLGNMQNGTGIPHVRGDDLKSFQIPLPPLPVQRRIADVLSAYDDLIENNRRRIAILEETARLAYRKWFGGVEEGRTATLGEIADVVMGQSPESKTYNDNGEGLPFHQGVTGFGFRYPRNEMWCTAGTRFAEEGDILFSVRAPVGRINVAGERIVIGRGLSAMRAKNGFQSWLLYTLKHHFSKEDMIGVGCIFASTTKKELFSVEVPYPSTDEIVAFEQTVSPMDEQVKTLSKQNATLATARDMLLPRLMKGGAT